LAEMTGYYYGLVHFLATALLLAWLYVRRQAVFGRLRSALVLATAVANVVFWAWPAAPPRFSVRGMTDILITRAILGAAHPHGAPSLGDPFPRIARFARPRGSGVCRRARRGAAPPMAPPGLVLPRRDHTRGAGLGQPLPA